METTRFILLVSLGLVLVMLWQAFEQWAVGGGTSAMLAALGALFFAASDSALALNRFRAPFPAAQAVVLPTYYLGQWLIALSVRA